MRPSRELNVLWIASYPKSGNTWVHSVLRRAGVPHGFPPGDMDVYNMERRGDRVSICRALASNVVCQPGAVLKTHSPFRSDRPLHGVGSDILTSAAYIHVIRNPLDLLLSYVNYTRIEYQHRADEPSYANQLFGTLLGKIRIPSPRDWASESLDSIGQVALDHALDEFSANGLAIEAFSPMCGSWLDNNVSWVNAVNYIPGCTIRYEDCVRDSAHFDQLARFFVFPQADMTAAVASFNERAKVLSSDKRSPEGVFFNKMAAYYFTQYFSAPAIDRFVGRHEASLEQLGYGDIVRDRRRAQRPGL